MKRLLLVVNGKGGVGKRFFVNNLVQYLVDHGIAHTAIDTDHENSTLKRFHTAAQFVDLEGPRQIDGILMATQGASLIPTTALHHGGIPLPDRQRRRNWQRHIHARAWTQADLVARLELLGASATRDVIANIESGRTSASDTLVFAIATVFDVSPAELFPPVRPGQGAPRPGQVPFTAPRRRRGALQRGLSDEPSAHALIEPVAPPPL